MIDPATQVPRPDVEELVWRTIRDLVPAKPDGTGLGRGLNTWAYSATAMPAPIGWLVAVSIQVDVRGRSKKLAFDRATAARRRMLGLPSAEWEEGVVTEVVIVEDAWWNPDPDGAPRYTARYEVRAHPRPASGRRSA